jgi:hypothetical protein
MHRRGWGGGISGYLANPIKIPHRPSADGIERIGADPGPDVLNL